MRRPLPVLGRPGPSSPPLSSGWLGLCGTASPWTPSREDTQAAAGTPREAPSRPEGRPEILGGSPSSRHSHRPQLFPEGSGRLPSTNNEAEAWGSRGSPEQLEQGGGQQGQEWGTSSVPRPGASNGFVLIQLVRHARRALGQLNLKKYVPVKMTPKYKRPLRAGPEAPTK